MKPPWYNTCNLGKLDTFLKQYAFLYPLQTIYQNVLDKLDNWFKSLINIGAVDIKTQLELSDFFVINNNLDIVCAKPIKIDWFSNKEDDIRPVENFLYLKTEFTKLINRNTDNVMMMPIDNVTMPPINNYFSLRKDYVCAKIQTCYPKFGQYFDTIINERGRICLFLKIDYNDFNGK